MRCVCDVMELPGDADYLWRLCVLLLQIDMASGGKVKSSECCWLLRVEIVFYARR